MSEKNANERARKLSAEICEALTAAVPENWAEATLSCAALVGSNPIVGISVRTQDGSSPAIGIPREMAQLCASFKGAMYEEGRGTWISFQLTLAPDQEPRFAFNYDEPLPPPNIFVPDHYRQDLSLFPRDPEHIPDWMQEILEKVPNFYMGIHGEPGEQYRGDIGPDLGEVGMAFQDAGWAVGDGEYSRELRVTRDHIALETLSQYGLIRMAGKIQESDWDQLIAFFTEQGWNFGASLYDGDDLIKEIKPERQVGP